VLFPYARREIAGFVDAQRDRADVRRWLDAAAADLASHNDAETVAGLIRWIDEDRKHTALKALQGLLWEAGYNLGAYRAHFYPDAAAALRRWHAAGHALYVYSSGSVPAQQLFFGHSEAGDLRPLISGWFDTEIGGKRDAESYRRIVGTIGRPADTILFLSDVVEELDAARSAGLNTTLLDRLTDYAQPRLSEASHGHRRVESFDAIELG